MTEERIRQVIELTDRLVAEVKRLREECKRWAELRIQHNEQYHDCVLRAEEAEAGRDKLIGVLKIAKTEVKEIQHRMFRLSDLHDNMEHWMKMQEMNRELQDKVVEPIAAVLAEVKEQGK